MKSILSFYLSVTDLGVLLNTSCIFFNFRVIFCYLCLILLWLTEIWRIWRFKFFYQRWTSVLTLKDLNRAQSLDDMIFKYQEVILWLTRLRKWERIVDQIFDPALQWPIYRLKFIELFFRWVAWKSYIAFIVYFRKIMAVIFLICMKCWLFPENLVVFLLSAKCLLSIVGCSYWHIFDCLLYFS